MKGVRNDGRARSSSAAGLKPGRTPKGVLWGFVERLFLAPTLIAIAIVLIRFAFRIGDHPAAFQVHSLRRFIPASSAMSRLTFKNLVRVSGLYVGRAFPEVRCRQTQAVRRRVIGPFR